MALAADCGAMGTTNGSFETSLKMEQISTRNVFHEVAFGKALYGLSGRHASEIVMSTFRRFIDTFAAYVDGVDTSTLRVDIYLFHLHVHISVAGAGRGSSSFLLSTAWRTGRAAPLSKCHPDRRRADGGA